MSTVISSPDMLSPAELSAVLNANLGGSAKIVSLRHETVGHGLLGDSLRFFIDYEGDAAGYPATIIGKFSPADQQIRQNGAMLGVYASEAGFYNEIASRVAVRHPRAYYAAVDTSGAEFGMIMEDLGPARAVDQLVGCSVGDAEQVMGQAAALHGPVWNDASAVRPWMQTQRDIVRQTLANFGPVVDAFLERLGGRLDDIEVATIERFGREILRIYDHRTRNRTIIHSDLRLDNILFDAAAGKVPIAVLDWQSLAPGSGPLDVAFFLCTSLPLDVRRSVERDLLALYLESLRSYGVADYDQDELWDDYRRSSWQAMFTAISASYSAKRTERADTLFTKIVRDGIALMNDLESFELATAD